MECYAWAFLNYLTQANFENFVALYAIALLGSIVMTTCKGEKSEPR